MGIGTGVRGKGFQQFPIVARQFNVILPVRHTNADSPDYVGSPDHHPQPGLVRTRSGDPNSPPRPTVDVDPASKRHGCAWIAGRGSGWWYVHGDYDLKGVIVPGRETDNRRDEGLVQGVPSFAPRSWRAWSPSACAQR